MRQDSFEAFLWVQVMLVVLLGATLALFLSNSSLRSSSALPELRLVMATVFMLITGLIALLSATRFGVDGRRFDLVLCGGFLVISLSWLTLSVVPTITVGSESTASTAGRTLGWALIAAAPAARGRFRNRDHLVVWALVAAAGAVLLPVWAATRGATDQQTTVTVATQAFFQLVAAVMFGDRYRRHGEDLDRWLSFFATLTLFASLGQELTPNTVSTDVARADFVALVGHGLLLVALWRAVRAAEFGRAVAEERARLAREVHDGLAQYLFTVSTHAAMLEAGADPAATFPRLKEAALAAQREARYAILALSSASGRAEFDTALRRYVDLLTVDGALEVEVDIDPRIHLAPDEQIEVLRIVQEGLANARRHAGAAHAWVEIGDRAGERYLAVRDDGEGFEPGETGGGQGLRNMRERAASIGGALSLRSAPGTGTSVEVVLRG